MISDDRGDRRLSTVGLAIAVALHLGALWGLWSHRLIPTPEEAVTLFVNFVAPPSPPKIEARPNLEQLQPRHEERPQPRQVVAEAAIISPAESLAPPTAPVITGPIELKAAGPVTLGEELSVSCTERTAPNYPTLSRRMGEIGTTLLRVELDEQGRVSAAQVVSESGFVRLDEAALAAVRTWRCNPARRNGQPVRAVALQPFKFILQGN